MGVAVHQFIHNPSAHIPGGEAALLCGNLSMENNLHQHIPQLLNQVVIVLFVNGVQKLVTLFH